MMMIEQRLFDRGQLDIPRRLTASPTFSAVVLLTVALLTVVAAPLAGQPNRPHFLGIDEETGLAKRAINCLLQDRTGFLWIGTTDGLGRFDGYSFTFYRQTHQPGSLSHPTVRDLVEDGDGRIWVATLGGGVNRFDPKTETFTTFRHRPDDPASLGNDQVEHLARTTDGAIWAGTLADGLARIDPQSGELRTFRHAPEDPGSLGDDRILALLADPSGGLWIGTEKGLDRYHPDRGVFEHHRADPDDPTRLASDLVSALAADPDGALWIGTRGDGLHRREPVSGAMKRFRHDPDDPGSLGEDEIVSLHVGPRGNLWIGTQRRGLDRLDPRTGIFDHHRHHPADPTSLRYGRVLELLTDRADVLWIATTEGLQHLNPLSFAFTHYRPDPRYPDQSLEERHVRSIFEDPSGLLWIGTANGFEILDRTRQELVHAREIPGIPETLHDSTVSAFTEDSAGDLWIGTLDAGAFRRRASDGSFIHYLPDPGDPGSLAGEGVPLFDIDSAGRLWAVVWNGGLHLFQPATGTFRRYGADVADSEGIGLGDAYVLHETPPGTYWVGTWANGLVRFSPENGVEARYRFEPRNPESLGSDRIQSIHGELAEDGTGTLWIATWGGGLSRFDAASGLSRTYTVADGLPSNSLYSILEDDDGCLWISTLRGLVRFNPEDEGVRTYDSADGVQNHLFYYHCAFRGAGGEMGFCGNDGLTLFHPSAIQDNGYKPPVVLTDLEILGEDLDPHHLMNPDATLVLDWDDRAITFTFAALDFTSPRKNRYAYRLGELRDTWMELGNRREVTFPRLAPGLHVLEVRGTNNHGLGREEALRLELRVTPPWWQTWTFRGVAALALLGLALALYHLKRRRTLERQRIRRERERLIAELEAKNAELERFTYTVSHDLKSPLFTIRGFLGLIRRDMASGDVERIQKDIERIESATSQMQHLLDALLELSRLGKKVERSLEVPLGVIVREATELLAGQIAEQGVEVTIAPDLPTRRVDRTRILQLFQNLLDNAIKFLGDEPSPRVEVFTRREQGEDVIVVRDNGLGIAPEDQERIFGIFDRLDSEIAGTGIGLALVERIVELHGGRIWVESAGAGKGSAFCFTLAETPAEPLS